MTKKFINCTTIKAFTLAELLIVIAIIGFIAILTIPTFVKNYNKHVWVSAQNLWQKRLIEATRQMNNDGTILGYNSTESFMKEFAKYVKIIQHCENNKLENCYASEIISSGEDNLTLKTKFLSNSQKLGHKSWETNTESFVAADGTTVLIAYNPNCEWIDPISSAAQNGRLDCLAMLIDVNGKKGPNSTGADILLSNATISTCDIKILGTCWAANDFMPTAINTCDGSEDIIYDDRGSTNERCATNYWAGAQKQCDELDMRMPTAQELADLATYIYESEDDPIGAHEDRRYSYDGSWWPNRREKLATLGIPVGDFTYWSNNSRPYGNSDSCCRDQAETRSFFANSTYWCTYTGYVDNSNVKPRARCVSKY